MTPYLVGLDLQGRRVVVVGAGTVAQRRLPRLVAAGADVLLIAPAATPRWRPSPPPHRCAGRPGRTRPATWTAPGTSSRARRTRR